MVRITDSTDFPVATTIAAALVEVEPGGMRELHWHPNNDDKSDHYADISLNQWMALTPPELVQARLNLNQKVMGALQKEKRPVV
jgi:oxalate decarboxylase